MGSGRNRCFGVVSFFLPDIALSSVPSGADTALFAIYVCFSLSYGENYGNELVSNVQCNDSDFPMVVCGAG